MNVFVIFLLLFIGILLCLLEVLVIPGVTIAGVGGFLAMGAGVYFSYQEFGTLGGNIVLACVVVINIIVIIYALRSKTWKSLSLSTNIDSTVDSDISKINVGDKGYCITRLAPMGRVKIGEYEVEAQSMIGLIGARTKVEVIKVEKSKIIVKQI